MSNNFNPTLLSAEIVTVVKTGLAAGESVSNLAEVVKNMIEREASRLGYWPRLNFGEVVKDGDVFAFQNMFTRWTPTGRKMTVSFKDFMRACRNQKPA